MWQWNMAGSGWGWWMVVGWIAMIVFWGLIIWLIVSLVSSLSQRGGSRARPGEPSPLEILEQRYARGEIDHQEFEERRRRLLGAADGERRSDRTPGTA
ncbi:MAG: SHOCT domain-containing protein [Thermomicrobiaceae bacterium]|nr:SHOCT domain-containing protein [Thermomicrobiaceae bacterium]